MENKISIKFLANINEKENEIYPLSCNLDDFDYNGFYFICIKMTDPDNENFSEMICIYCGETSSSIKSRLKDHYKKLKDKNHKWYLWLSENNKSIEDVYFVAIETYYGLVLENLIINSNISSVVFSLNTRLNGHSKIINIKEIDNIRLLRLTTFIENIHINFTPCINDLSKNIQEMFDKKNEFKFYK